MEENEQDIVIFSDDDGNEIPMEVIYYFEHEGEQYAMLIDVEAEDAEDIESEEKDVYLMKIVVNEEEDMEEFLPVEDEKMDELTRVAEKIFEEWENE